MDIKFRAWDESEKRFLGWDELQECTIQDVFNLAFTSTQQFTGLHDKNGREIYEGDIVKKPVEINQEVHGVWELREVWMANGTTFFGFIQSEKQKNFPRRYMVGTIEGEIEDMKSFVFATDYQLDEMEVVGNIYENPEMLINDGL